MFREGSSLSLLTESQDHALAKIAREINAKAILNKENLITLLDRGYGFPDEHRIICWRYILQLPCNKEKFLMLAQQPIHPKVRSLPNRLPLRYSSKCQRLLRLISTLTYWHPPLAECDWLPSLLFPFLQMFERDSQNLFEVCVTIIHNWCSEWLLFVPNPPITILSRIEHIAKLFGGDAPLAVAWPALRSFFGEVATTEACIVLLDHILSSKPVFLEYLVIAYCLRKNRRIDHLTVGELIRHARVLCERHVTENPNQAVFAPLGRGFYPVIPIIKKTNNWNQRELERIRAEAEVVKTQQALNAGIGSDEARLKQHRRRWAWKREDLRWAETEQITEVRRREEEQGLRNSRAEEAALSRRRAEIERRKSEEQTAMVEWRGDCERLREEMANAERARRDAWALWLQMREAAADVAKAEIDTEMELLGIRDKAQAEELERYIEITRKADATEREMLAHAIERSQEIEDTKNEIKENLESTRRHQQEQLLIRQKGLER
jgi:hypothetical protein